MSISPQSIFVWSVFVGLSFVCLVGCVNFIRVTRSGDKVRLQNLLWGLLTVGMFTFSIGFYLVSPLHNMRVSQNIIEVALGLNIIFQVMQLRRKRER